MEPSHGPLIPHVASMTLRDGGHPQVASPQRSIGGHPNLTTSRGTDLDPPASGETHRTAINNRSFRS
jgi:hypothetical protein